MYTRAAPQSPRGLGNWRLRMLGLSRDGIDPRDPGLFLHDIDLSSGRAGFLRTGRADLSAEPFLDHRWRAPDRVDATLSLAQLPAASSVEAQKEVCQMKLMRGHGTPAAGN